MAWLPFLCFFLWLMFCSQGRCPECVTPLPLFAPRANKRIWLEGGWICPNCGIEVDSAGRKVALPWVLDRRTLWLQCAFLAALAAIGVLLFCMVLY